MWLGRVPFHIIHGDSLPSASDSFPRDAPRLSKAPSTALDSGRLHQDWWKKTIACPAANRY